jgi:hypothetical protein
MQETQDLPARRKTPTDVRKPSLGSQFPDVGVLVTVDGNRPGDGCASWGHSTHQLGSYHGRGSCGVVNTKFQRPSCSIPTTQRVELTSGGRRYYLGGVNSAGRELESSEASPTRRDELGSRWFQVVTSRSWRRVAEIRNDFISLDICIGHRKEKREPLWLFKDEN